MKISTVLFDMDGLMVDTEGHYHQVQAEIIRKYGGTDPGPELAGRMMGQKPLDSMAIFASMTGVQVPPEILLEERSQVLRERFRTGLRPMPGLEEILQFLKESAIPMGVVTGNSRIFLDLTLDKLSIRDYFDSVTSSDEVERGKPEPDLYRLACQKMDTAPDRTVVLEDSANGILSGKRAGCIPIAVPNEHTIHQDFGAAHSIVSGLTGAREWIGRMLKEA